MSIKKIPMRMCVGCRQMKPKSELIRIVKTPTGEILLDTVGKQNGRGAYVCKCEACLKKIKKAKALSNAFGCFVEDSVYERLEKEFSSIGS